MRRKPVPKWVSEVLGDSLPTTPADEAKEPAEEEQNDETGTDDANQDDEDDDTDGTGDGADEIKWDRELQKAYRIGDSARQNG